MIAHKTYSLRVIAKPLEDVPGEWFVHCLDLDLMSQGTSLQHAFRMLYEAALIAVGSDLLAGLDPLDRRAPDEFWEERQKLLESGRPISLKEAESLPVGKRLATEMRFSIHIEPHEEVQPLMHPEVPTFDAPPLAA